MSVTPQMSSPVVSKIPSTAASTFGIDLSATKSTDALELWASSTSMKLSNLQKRTGCKLYWLMVRACLEL